MKQRWLPVGLVALGVFLVNAIARLVVWKGGFATEEQQVRIGFYAVVVVGIIMIGAAAWWALRFPIGRIVADLGAATLVGALASGLVGPFFGGSRPFREGLGFFVGQFLLYGALATVGVALGFMIVVALGKDWKSRGLKRYEQRYRAKPPRIVRG